MEVVGIASGKMEKIKQINGKQVIALSVFLLFEDICTI